MGTWIVWTASNVIADSPGVYSKKVSWVFVIKKIMDICLVSVTAAW